MEDSKILLEFLEQLRAIAIKKVEKTNPELAKQLMDFPEKALLASEKAVSENRKLLEELIAKLKNEEH